MRKFEVGIGPMSSEVIDGCLEFSAKRGVKVMLIASRNQVDAEELGGGYVANTTDFALSVMAVERGIGANVMMCRDHTGPYLSAADDGLSEREAIERTKISIENDIKAAFDLIHIDTCMAKAPYMVAEELYEFAQSCVAKYQPPESPVLYEFGSEENIGVAASIEKYRKDCQFYSRFKPEFVVGQTGSLVRSIKQVGTFDYNHATKLAEIATEFGTKLKEHNADYLSASDLDHRDYAGVQAINIAPEFGVIQTRELFRAAKTFGIDSKEFYMYVLEQKKWKKWDWKDSTPMTRVLCSGHYHFQSEPYLELVALINREMNFTEHVKFSVKARLAEIYG